MGCLHLTDLFQKLSLQIKSADEIVNATEEEANVGPGYPPDFHSFAAANNKNQMGEFKRQLLSAVCETKKVLLQSIAAGVPDIIVNSETPERAKEVLLNIVSLRKQVSEAEDDLFRSLEQHIKSKQRNMRPRLCPSCPTASSSCTWPSYLSCIRRACV